MDQCPHNPIRDRLFRLERSPARFFWFALIAFVSAAVSLRADTTNLSGATAINSLPFEITAPGVYYLDQNLNSGNINAITVYVDGVTIDLNGHTISDGAAGSGVGCFGIYAPNCSRLCVRNGTIRGFAYGIYISGFGYGHLVENVRVIESTSMAVRLDATGGIVRHCQAFKIGGSTNNDYPDTGGFIFLGGYNTIQDCDVGELIPNATYPTCGIYVGDRSMVVGNRVSGAYYGISMGGNPCKYRDNLCAASVTVPYTGGINAGNN